MIEINFDILNFNIYGYYNVRKSEIQINTDNTKKC